MSPKRFAWESGRHPFEVLLHLWAVLNGVTYLIGAIHRPNSITESLPHWVQSGWLGLLLAGGATGLVAAWLQGRVGHVEQGLRVEGAALCFIAGGAVIYTAAIFAAAGAAGFSAGTFIGSYAIAVLWRLWHIRRDLRQVEYLGRR